MEKQEMNPQDRRLEIKGLDVNLLYSGVWCESLTSSWRDEWSIFSTVLNRLKTQWSAWLCYCCCL